MLCGESKASGKGLEDGPLTTGPPTQRPRRAGWRLWAPTLGSRIRKARVAIDFAGEVCLSLGWAHLDSNQGLGGDEPTLRVARFTILAQLLRPVNAAGTTDP